MLSQPRKCFVIVLTFLLSQFAVASEYKPGEVIVKYKDEAFRSRSEMNTLYDSVGVENVRHYNGLIKGFEHLILDDGVDVEKAIESLSKDSKVDYAQPNYILYALPVREGWGDDSNQLVGRGVPCVFPGIPYPPGCEDSPDGGGGGFPPSKRRPELKAPPSEVFPGIADPQLDKVYGLSKIGATEAWSTHRGNKDFIVADIDTGVDYNHEDLAFNMWRNPNPTNQDIVGYDFTHNDGLPFDDNGHGTHTGGTIAAVGDNGIGISGVIQNVSLMSVKFLSAEGSGTTADAIRAIDYAVSHGARVLSNSWGGSADKNNKALKDVVEKARQSDVLFVAAAGNESNDNDGPDPSYPAAFDNDNIIAVAATDENDKLAYFSNYGRKTTHLAAPGVRVYSTMPGNQYKASSGTSMACPYVAGAAALLWSKHPRWSYKKVKEMLMKSVDPLASLENKTISGGRLNIRKALEMSETRRTRR